MSPGSGDRPGALGVRLADNKERTVPASNPCVQSPVVNSAFGIDLNSLSAEEIAGLGETAERILNDPLLLQQLTDRVYRLLQDDLARQSERGLGRRSHGR